MKLPAEEKARLEQLCSQFRIDLIETLHARQTGHPGGSLSLCEILSVLYFEEMNVDPANPKMADRDRMVLCKGHAAPILYRILAEKGFFPVEEMATLRCFETRLQGHPCPLETPGVDAATGPLGIGLSAALGMSMALKMDNSPARVYAILGDGEINEGTVWEALMAAVKFKAFGWNTIECDGHDLDSVYEAVQTAKTVKGVPTIILAHTVKGKGVSFMEGKNAWHGKPINDEEYALAMAELGGAK